MAQDEIQSALIRLEQRMEQERLQLALGTYELEDMVHELQQLEDRLRKSYTYVLPVTRRRLRRRARELHMLIAQRHNELEALRRDVDSLGFLSQ